MIRGPGRWSVLVGLLLLRLWVPCAAGASEAGNVLPTGDYHLRLPNLLEGEVTFGNRTYRRQDDLYLLVQHRDGHWQEQGWIYTPMWNGGPERPIALNIDVDAKHRRLRIGCTVTNPTEPTVARWFEQSHAFDLTITIHHQDDGWHGAWSGRLDSRDLGGPCLVVHVAPAEEPADDFVSLTVAEHPRLVIRRAQLPALRRAAMSADGRVVLARLDALLAQPVVWRGPQADAGSHATGHGLRHLLANSDVDDHADRARDLIARRMRIPVGGQPKFDEAAEVIGVALAYDCCFDAWDEDFRLQVTDWLEAKGQSLQLADVRRAGRSLTARWNAVCRGAAGIAALAVLRDPGRFPQRPQGIVFHDLQAPADVKTDKRPVVRLRHDQVPERWLIAGPFHEAAGADVLAQLGGVDQAHPRRGTKVVFNGQRRTFQALDERDGQHKNKHFTGRDSVIDVLGPIDRAYHTTSAYTTIVAVDDAIATRWFSRGSHGVKVRAWLAGRELREGDVVRLQPGRYPLVLLIEVGETEPWGEMWAAPRFLIIDDEEAERLRHGIHRRLVDWRQAHDRWQMGGKPTVLAPISAARAGRFIRRYLVYGVGERGFGVDGDAYTAHAATTALFPFLRAWQAVFGRDLHGDAGHRWILPNLIMRSQRTGEHLVVADYGNRIGDLAPTGLFPVGLNQCAAAQRRHMQAIQAALTGPALGIDAPHEALYALANLCDHAPTAHARLPRVLDDRRGGLVILRGGDDLQAPMACVALKAPDWATRSTFPEAGSFRLCGLGQTWAVSGPHGASRSGQNIIQIDDYDAWGAADLRQLTTHDDGSGVVDLDLSQVYRTREGDPAEVTVRRTLAVDYSGRAGVPAVVALYDRGRGGDRWTWRMNTASPPALSERGFVVGGDSGPRLVATVLVPEKPEVTVDQGSVSIRGGRRFLVVMTLDAEAHPPVTRDGDRIRVGGKRLLDLRRGMLQLTR